MNREMTVWFIIVGVFVVALIFRFMEKIHEGNIKDAHLLDAENKDDARRKEKINEYDDFDEFGDL